jgi:hypothetical protein
MSFVSFFKVLYSMRVRQEGKDKLCCASSERGLFDVKSFYSVMGCNDGSHFPWKSVWRTKIPDGGLFRLVGSPRKDHFHGQSLEVVRYCG